MMVRGSQIFWLCSVFCAAVEKMPNIAGRLVDYRSVIISTVINGVQSHPLLGINSYIPQLHLLSDNVRKYYGPVSIVGSRVSSSLASSRAFIRLNKRSSSGISPFHSSLILSSKQSTARSSPLQHGPASPPLISI